MPYSHMAMRPYRQNMAIQTFRFITNSTIGEIHDRLINVQKILGTKAYTSAPNANLQETCLLNWHSPTQPQHGA